MGKCLAGQSEVSPDGRNRIEFESGAISVFRDGRRLLGPQPAALELDRGEASVELVARDDGVAYRFVTGLEGEVTVSNETAALVFPDAGTELWVGYNWCDNPRDPKQDKLQHGCASIYTKTTPGGFVPDGRRLAYLPLTARFADGTTVLVSESDLRDYPGWHLKRFSKYDNRLDGVFARYPVREREFMPNEIYRRVGERQPYLVRTAGRRTYPWRVFAIAAEPIGIVEQRIVGELAKPAAGDYSWVKPGLSAWEWWNDWHLEDVAFRPGLNTATYLAYLDFAAEWKLPYLTIDAGWKNSDSLYNVNRDIDLEAVLRHAAEKGVGTILWTSWRCLDGRQEEYFRHYAAKGVKGFKIDFMERDDAEVMRFMEETLRIAAKYRLLIDYHGCGKPTGLEVTYPNLVGVEGVHGLELMKMGIAAEEDFPAHDCQVVFTRAALGTVDYTPGAMQNRSRTEWRPDDANPASQGTRCHQLALYVLFPVPLQFLCDSPSRYRRNPECTRLLAAMPTVWDETKGLAGEIGRYAAVARRRGRDWYLGAITDWNARKLEIDTSFLGEGEWSMEIYRDAPDADRNPEHWARETRRVRSGEHLEIRLAPGGGCLARLERVK